ncbi:MAG TPA: tRNA lysidine(34) synthetase TilS [Clostridiales bacterium UBA8153]|nr:tRNA lysidine(34) synthetase TilS [Clostridiales bacterium UBA8153]
MGPAEESIELVLKRVRTFFLRYRPLSPGGRILIAASGGPDSTVLLDALFRLRRELQFDLHVAHLNHMLRGEEACADAQYVRELAEKRGLACTIDKANVPGRLGTVGGGRQQQARSARYAFLANTAQEVGASVVATGHTRDDHAETVMWRVIRGTSLRGLSGIPPVHGTVIRPLLWVWRHDIEAYLRSAGLYPRRDSSNLDSKYTRNWVRLELFPVLEQLNPEVKRALAELGDVARDDHALLEQWAGTEFRRLARHRGREVHLDREALVWLEPALARRVLVQGMETVQPDAGAELGRRHLDAVLALARSARKGAKLSLPMTVHVCISGEHVVISAAQERERGMGERSLPVPGRLELGDGRAIEARLHHEVPAVLAAGTGVAYVDFEQVTGPLRVRSRQPGDRFQPLGMSGSKKLTDYLIDQKVPLAERRRVPVVVCDAGVVWLGGQRLDHRFRVLPGTRQVLELRLVGPSE